MSLFVESAWTSPGPGDLADPALRSRHGICTGSLQEMLSLYGYLSFDIQKLVG